MIGGKSTNLGRQAKIEWGYIFENTTILGI